MKMRGKETKYFKLQICFGPTASPCYHYSKQEPEGLAQSPELASFLREEELPEIEAKINAAYPEGNIKRVPLGKVWDLPKA